MPFTNFERRQFARFHVRWVLQGKEATPESFEVRNISLGGFAIESPVFFPLGEEHPLEFGLADGRRVMVRATTVHCSRTSPEDQPARYITGFAFVRSPADEPVIEELVRTVLEASAPALNAV